MNIVQDLFRTTREEYLMQARQAARRHLDIYDTVTILDVLSACPYPAYLGKSKSILGKVFQTGTFAPVGYTRSTDPKAKRHIIRVWALKHPPLPEKWVSRMEVDDGR